jgi:hypothetical protein
MSIACNSFDDAWKLVQDADIRTIHGVTSAQGSVFVSENMAATGFSVSSPRTALQSRPHMSLDVVLVRTGLRTRPTGMSQDGGLRPDGGVWPF